MIQTTEKTFLKTDYLKDLAAGKTQDKFDLPSVLKKALRLKGLNLEEAAFLLSLEDPNQVQKMLDTAATVKQEIYGKRLVLFAPLYAGNKCCNNCTYCAFRKDNTSLKRSSLSMEQLEKEVEALLDEGHKRLLLLCGETPENGIDYVIESLERIYAVSSGRGNIRRINVEIAPLKIEEFKRLKKANIGTYTCFQETYDPDLYGRYHPSGPKADYQKRLFVMDRAMEAGIDDVGIGALFGLADYRFEVLALLSHAAHLEERFNCGPHTVSVPRLEPAENAPDANQVPFPVSDQDFKKIIAVLRMSLPYTGIILTTRESEALRNELFAYGVSQISAGSRTNPGAYSEHDEANSQGSQFSLGDHRNLEEVISTLINKGYIPSFCTGCYRKGRVGQDFMDLAKPGLIKSFCMPNGIFTFAEYLLDYASAETRKRGFKLIDQLCGEQEDPNLAAKMQKMIERTKNGERDLYF